MTKLPLPRLEIYPARIAENARAIGKLVSEHGGAIAVVGKVLCAHEAAVRALLSAGASMYADSRIENLAKVQAQGLTKPDGSPVELLLLRLPEQSKICETVAHCDLALVSELETIKLLGAEAVRQGKEFGIVIMVDVGDLREGVWGETVVDVVVAAATVAGIRVRGIGCNLACYGGVEPDEENMSRFVNYVAAAEQTSGLNFEIISGGNSSALDMLLAGTMPSKVNHFRMGESVILGRNVLTREPAPGTRQDAVRLVAEVIEVQSKPSLPVGKSGQNAFGEVSTYVDRGIRRRAILALGRQDAVVDGLEPLDSGMIILGASSDHLIIDVEDAAEPIKVGDEIAFWPSYGATLALSTSAYVHKTVVE